MSEVSETVRRDIISGDSNHWMSDNLKVSMAQSAITTMPMTISHNSSDEDSKDQLKILDLNGLNEDSKFPEEKDNLKRLAGSMDTICQQGDSGCCSASSFSDGNCKNCYCKCSGSAAKRRCSTSDINFNAGDLFSKLGSFPLKKNSLGGTSLTAAKSVEKIDKINLANLVFNPNFKNSAGCVNLPVIRAGQNLAHKNAQRAALAKDSMKETELNQLTQQAAIDLITQQLQPPSLTKLNVKLQQLVQQRNQLKASDICELGEGGNPDVGDMVHTFSGKAQAPSQSNALRYKTELCRSYEEGGECRFGTACTFAHGPEELRPVPRHPLYKTEFCRTYHQHGYCQYGTRCHFIHDAEEADKNAPLRGCKSWGRHDQLSGALLSLASSSGLLEAGNTTEQPTRAADNDVLLANLRRLYALRTMNGQDAKPAQQQEANCQFSMSQPMAQQLSVAHQQLANGSHHMPLSMTQPLPMDALYTSLQRAGHLGQRPHVMPTAGHNRVESIANDYSAWGVTPPPSPTYSGVSPFGSYQQFSPLPHHHMAGAHPAHPHQSYPHYPFSATAPDLSAALSMSPYAVSPQHQGFSNTVNVGHLLPDQNGHYSAAVSTSNLSSAANKISSVAPAAPTAPLHSAVSSTGAVAPGGPMQNPMWPPTSAEVSSVIDKELFGFGLDQHAPHVSYPPQPYQTQQFYHHLQHPQQPKTSGTGIDQAFKAAQSSANNQKLMRNAEQDIMNLINNEKYVSRDSKSLRPIMESSDEQSVRPKQPRSKPVLQDY